MESYLCAVESRIVLNNYSEKAADVEAGVHVANMKCHYPNRKRFMEFRHLSIIVLIIDDTFSFPSEVGVSVAVPTSVLTMLFVLKVLKWIVPE